MSSQLVMVREQWNAFAHRFTETLNKRMTMQCSQHLHSHMQLDTAKNVLEIAAGAGLGSLDVVKYLEDGRSNLPRETKRTFAVTDLSPVMVGLAEKNLSGAGSPNVEIKCQEANGQDLAGVATGSIDRCIASLCIQLAPDPDAILREASRVLTADGIAGFTIWGSPERSGIFTIASASDKEMGMEEGAGEHSNFAMGKDLPVLRQRFAAAGFTRVQIWPFQSVVELWSGEEFAKFLEDSILGDDETLQSKRRAIVTRMADEWLARGTPIGLETYIILARK